MILETLSESEALFYALTQDESGLDLAEFLYVDSSDEGKKNHGIFRAWPYQVAWFRNPAQQHADAAGRAVGKALWVEEPILTTKGWSTMGKLKKGDYVFSEKGEPVRVKEAFKVMKGRPCYKVTFSDGSEVVADAEHNWLTYKEQEVVDANLAGMAPTPSVSTTVEIMDSLKVTISDPEIGVSNEFYNHSVPFIDGIKFWGTELTTADLRRCVFRLAGYPSRKIIAVEEVESVPVRCIEVDNPTHLFLVGENLIPTHNSMSIKFRAMAFPFIYPGEEMLITAPEAVHLDAVTDNFERMIMNMRLMRELIDRNIKHKPFHINWKTNSRTMGRIPQKDGHGVQGVHAMVLEHDEAAAYPEPGWEELPETVQQNNPRTRWRVHGVSFGFGGRFNEIISGEDPNWTVTRLPAMIRPNWNDAEREKRILEYGGYESSGYRRNILGLPADIGSPIFPLNQLMAVVDRDPNSEYNTSEYYLVSLDEGQVRDLQKANPGADPAELLSIPLSHMDYSSVWIGMDIGWTISPSSICVFAETDFGKKKGLKLLSRILLNRFSGPDQARIVTYLMKFYRPVAFAMDATGAGKPLWDFIEEQVKKDQELSVLKGRVKNINFSERVIVGFDENVKVSPSKGKNAYLEAAIKRPFVEASTDSVRKLVGDKRILLPEDIDLIGELQAAPQRGATVGNTLDEYGRSGRKKGMHNLDAIRCAVFSYDTRLVDQMIASHDKIWEPPGAIWF